MKKLNNNSGFTLIEIIVVLIIVGILAAIALPNMFANVNKSKAQDAFAQFEGYKPGIEACFDSHIGAENTCTTVPQPANTTNFNFTYAVSSITNSTGGAVNGISAVTATDLVKASLVNGNAGDYITLTRNTGGTYSDFCTGAFAGVC